MARGTTLGGSKAEFQTRQLVDPSGRYVVTYDKEGLTLLHARTLREVLTHKAANPWPEFSPDGRMILLRNRASLVVISLSRKE